MGLADDFKAAVDDVRRFFGGGGERWIRWRGRPVLIDDQGRIRGGRVPADWRGIAMADLKAYNDKRRAIENIDCAPANPPPTHFRRKIHGVNALLDANPELESFMQAHKGNVDAAFVEWFRRGQRGPIPRTRDGLPAGNFDALNERWELRRNRRQIQCWTQALYQTVPGSRRWADFDDRIGVLQEAVNDNHTGPKIVIHPPDEATRLKIAQASIEDCERRVDAMLAALHEDAADGALDDSREPTPAEIAAAEADQGDGGDVPF